MDTLEQPAASALHGRRYVIAGGSGFLGLSLARYLSEAGAAATILSRSAPGSGPRTWTPWDGRTLGDWVATLDRCDGLINLAGRTVDCIKTPDHCDEILRSRVESTTVLGAACRQLREDGKAPPPAWIQMSTAHIYGDPPEAVCDEDSAFGYGLAPMVGKAWEETLANSALPEQRTVVLRTSFVVGRGGGALPALTRLARFGAGGRVGHGRQGFSWIHETDMNRIFEAALADEAMSGPYIASSPNPVSQAEFMRTLRQAIGMPIGIPTPEWLARIGARWVMQTDPELALYGRYVQPRRLLDHGFQFSFPDLSAALRNLLGS